MSSKMTSKTHVQTVDGGGGAGSTSWRTGGVMDLTGDLEPQKWQRDDLIAARLLIVALGHNRTVVDRE